MPQLFQFAEGVYKRWLNWPRSSPPSSFFLPPTLFLPSPHTLLPPSPSPQLQAALAHVFLSQELSPSHQNGRRQGLGGWVSECSCFRAKEPYRTQGWKMQKYPSSSAEATCSLIVFREPAAAAPPPRGPCPDPAPWGGPARPRSHRRAEPESRSPARPPLRTSPAREGARSALPTQPTPPGGKGCSKHGENNPKRPWGSPRSLPCQCHHSCRSKQSPGHQMLTAKYANQSWTSKPGWLKFS